ncbi:hypothetical protein SERLA73DRAFT_191319 [Serpula lacrymans var. lacrymans S7.3]|uniref:Uncharacterized protein n=1 Tax=Serpula lacrymans var. lacrymans (strain S7.3) TaxID=936435 RepID=F8QHD4_SERL3|nr:hypothetical protein SERLA73DRAFT_191319 [Serpula lacrymans var. lacrymans S7.3]
MMSWEDTVKKRARQNTTSINTVPLLSVRHSKKICIHKNDSKIKNNCTVNEYSAEKRNWSHRSTT